MFVEAAGVLQWLLPYFVFTTTNTALMCILYADKRDAEVMKVLMFGTSALVALCLLFGLVWRGEGIAAGLSAGEGLITLLLFLMIGKTVRLNYAGTFGPFLASSLVMGVFMVIMRDVHVGAAVVFGLMLFLVAIFVLKGVTMEDLRFLRQRFV
jgi:O-antigen/teichoic acid export membrane protein